MSRCDSAVSICSADRGDGSQAVQAAVQNRMYVHLAPESVHPSLTMKNSSHCQASKIFHCPTTLLMLWHRLFEIFGYIWRFFQDISLPNDIFEALAQTICIWAKLCRVMVVKETASLTIKGMRFSVQACLESLCYSLFSFVCESDLLCCFTAGR